MTSTTTARPQHQHADELHERRGLAGQDAYRIRGCDDLRDGVDREAGEDPVLIIVQPENRREGKETEDATMASTAVYAIAEATSSFFAPTTGASAAMAELPQIALPHATRSACTGDKPSARPIALPVTIAAITMPTIDATSGRPALMNCWRSRAEAEQDDRDLEQEAGGERDPRIEPGRRCPENAHDGADQDGQNDRFKRDMPHRRGQRFFGDPRERGHDEDDPEAGETARNRGEHC